MLRSDRRCSIPTVFNPTQESASVSARGLGQRLPGERRVGHRHGVERARAERLRRGVEVRLLLLEEGRALLVGPGSQRRARNPAHERVELRDLEAVVLEQRAHVGIREPVGARRLVVAEEERDAREAAPRGRGHALGEVGAWDGARAEHEIFATEHAA